MLGDHRLSLAHRLVIAAALATSGCSFIGLDDLAGGEGGAEASTSADASTAVATATATSASTGESSSTASTTSGSGGSGGGEGGLGGAGGHGGEAEVCTGCVDDDGACQSGDTVESCGVDAAACIACEVSSACDVVSCVDGGCVTEKVAVDTPCDAGNGLGSGACDDDGECVAVAENCGNGIDDDANTLIDCADPACGAFMCFPEAPPLWLGPFHVYQGDSLSCPAAAGEDGLPSLGTGFTSDAVECPTCTCQAECEAIIDFAFGAAPSCSSLNLSQTVPPDECTIVGAQGTSFKYVFEASPGEGTCETASVGGIGLPAVTFSDRLTSCEPTIAGGGCDENLTCVPRPPDVGGVSARTCIARDGDRACPPGFPDRQNAGEGISDERSCTACGCEDVVCGGKITMSATPNCTCPLCRDITFDDDTCGELTAKDLSATYRAESTCKPTGGAVEGTIEYADDGYTICCVE